VLWDGKETDSVLLHGDCLVALRDLKADLVHACVTDPPYGIAFSRKGWDTFASQEAFSRFNQAWAREVFRVLKPGGTAFICCGQKSFAADFEAVGFVLRTQFMWYFGTGMPAFEGGPPSASEVIIVMVKPGDEPVEANVEKVGQYATAGETDRTARAFLRDNPDVTRATVIDAEGQHFLTYRKADAQTEDVYVPKVSPRERDFGCEDLPLRDKARGIKARNPHPTTKPVKLMKVLVRRACPPGGIVLDPFTGSGTTGMACAYEGRQFIGIERSPCDDEPEDYIGIAMRRIAKARGGKQRPFHYNSPR